MMENKKDFSSNNSVEEIVSGYRGSFSKKRKSAKKQPDAPVCESVENDNLVQPELDEVQAEPVIESVTEEPAMETDLVEPATEPVASFEPASCVQPNVVYATDSASDVGGENYVAQGSSAVLVAPSPATNKPRFKKWTRSEIEIFIYALLGVLFLAVFAYGPMYGIILAFKDGDSELNIARAISATEWVGFYNFKEFITDPEFINVLLNTLGLNIIQLLITFPAPILFAIMLNEIHSAKFKNSVQIITFLPHFLSWVVFGGIFIGLLDYDSGMLNYVIRAFGGNPVDVLGEAKYFWALVIITALIKGVGWGSVIYIAAIAGISPEIYEAAQIDGANRWHKAIYITIPSIAPTITLFLILSISGLLNSGFDQIWVFQNTNNLARSEVIDTFMYKYGVINSRYSYTTALGLFKSIVSVILLIIGNFFSKMFTGKGII